MRMTTARRCGYLLVAAFLIAACSDNSHSAAPTTIASSPSTQTTRSAPPADPSTFAGAVCGSISTWQNRMVDAANAFSTDSPNLDLPARRARYSRAFDDQKAITNDLRAELQVAPATGVTDAEAIRAVLIAATGDVQTTIQENQADAASHPDSDFEFQAVKEDRLFGGTEKTLSEILKPLDEQSRVHNVPVLGGSCGRS
jgi:hypothetical protein